ncbi:MAG: glucose-6-phosphate isomerase, partial [Bdellovibrionales bacterium]
MTSLTQKPEWQDLLSHKESLPPLKEMGNNFMLSLNGIHLDYSKNTVSKKTLDKLFALAKACDFESWRDKMFSGEKINNTEDRAVLHTALRAPKDQKITVDGEDVVPLVHDTLARMKNI